MLLVAVVLLALGPSALPVRAAGVGFDTPTATATYGQRLDFRVQMTADAAPQRVELELWFPDSLGPFLVPVPVPAQGRQALEQTWDIATDGHLQPNTTVRSRWVAYASDGTATRSAFATVTYTDTRFAWRTLEGDLVRVHWYDGDDAFARRALDIGERAVADTAALLRVTETEPIDFFIYADTAQFREALGPGLRENVGGQANPDIRTLFALIEPGQIDDAWVGIVIPHELTHLVFDTAVSNPYRAPPVWLNEGLAVYLSESYGPSDQRLVRAAVADDTLLPLPALAGSYPRKGDRIPLAYAEGASAVDFLVRSYGRDALVALVRAYKDGVTDDQAFTAATRGDAAAFETAWLANLGADRPVQYGPRPAPPGPLPPGWAPAPATPVASGTPGGATPPATPGAPGSPSAPSTTGGGSIGIAAVLAIVFLLIVVGALVAYRRRVVE